MIKYLSLTGVLLLAACAGPEVLGKGYYSRQYYSSWKKSSSGYHYRTYYYKPRASYRGYRHHYAIYHSHRPRYVYYYNPYKKQYWGRCPVADYQSGKPTYSLLPEKARKANLEDIAEADFPPPKAMPRIPEADDDEAMEPPPDDLPPGKGLPQK